MWGPLRIILLIANTALLVTLAYLYSTRGLPSGEDRLPIYGITIFLALNFVYLLLLDKQVLNRRFSRLIDLWFDAKENELRQRVNQSRPDK
jgi:hypothetical protein